MFSEWYPSEVLMELLKLTYNQVLFLEAIILTVTGSSPASCSDKFDSAMQSELRSKTAGMALSFLFYYNEDMIRK